MTPRPRVTLAPVARDVRMPEPSHAPSFIPAAMRAAISARLPSSTTIALSVRSSQSLAVIDRPPRRSTFAPPAASVTPAPPSSSSVARVIPEPSTNDPSSKESVRPAPVRSSSATTVAPPPRSVSCEPPAKTGTTYAGGAPEPVLV